MSGSVTTISQTLKQRGMELGFALVGIAPAARPETLGYFQDWLRQGLHGTMEYLPRREKAYEHPQGVQIGVKSIIVTAMHYGSEKQRELGQTGADQQGRIAAYAQGIGDYHDTLRLKLQLLADELHQLQPTARTRIAIDTAPLLERDIAQRAGLGWFGKNTMLINKWAGSYFFLGAVLTDQELSPDQPHQTDHCGTCTRCLEACPTDAFPAPHVLNASRCISYLTIELRDRPLPLDLRQGVGDWLFGCDVCQQVCPWNRKPRDKIDPVFQSRPEHLPSPRELLRLSDQEFQMQYKKTPFSRPGRAGMARNAAIVLGNSGNAADVPLLMEVAIQDVSPLVRGAAIWALGKIGGETAHGMLFRRLEEELDGQVLEEIHLALQHFHSDGNPLATNDVQKM